MYLLLCHCTSIFNICQYFVSVSEDILTDQITPAIQATLSDDDVRSWAEVNFLCTGQERLIRTRLIRSST